MAIQFRSFTDNLRSSDDGGSTVEDASSGFFSSFGASLLRSTTKAYILLRSATGGSPYLHAWSSSSPLHREFDGEEEKLPSFESVVDDEVEEQEV
ncbi:hypothetical protein F2Q69_00020554 [Brassica cretica]|uniref:Uncharacterized protein n=1 Tax=Brassica cretica TaxID=69181 RepID=A0A8S9Q931_BRACR|nr:hypothetical protein F2Q69_00020554 [Brassica cretica]